ncbi:class I SAM-dependent methyltransferase [soil metagenome]
MSDTARWILELRGADAPPVGRLIDIGSGPGVGTCELARLFPAAHVTAVDGSPAMLDRTMQRAAADGLQGRVSTHLAELPGGLDELGRADVIWASMSLHHIGDEVAMLRKLRDLLEPGGLLAVVEFAESAHPMTVLPDDVGLGRPGLRDRLDRARAQWFEAMRAGLPDSVPSADLPTMVGSAGLEVVGSRLATRRFDPPLSEDARRLAFGHVGRIAEQLDEHLDDDDLDTLGVLSDADDRRSVMHRPDVFVASTRQILVARPIGSDRVGDRASQSSTPASAPR